MQNKQHHVRMVGGQTERTSGVSSVSQDHTWRARLPSILVGLDFSHFHNVLPRLLLVHKGHMVHTAFLDHVPVPVQSPVITDVRVLTPAQGALNAVTSRRMGDLVGSLSIRPRAQTFAAEAAGTGGRCYETCKQLPMSRTLWSRSTAWVGGWPRHRDEKCTTRAKGL
eukprot:CAMPEP_0171058484 /NCGR_PEP_ID=MMETSP0766_2-20121228/2525_1 /TAXON_ID=439317 /ORGANISM="Gambierdiscus australes, Strain CAWD 149" /LENGTH=166 /DNA_ID=CAMNT_0011513769 /DNA_START=246 /DNA_END=744 /DNA_ORIENTATION=-